LIKEKILQHPIDAKISASNLLTILLKELVLVDLPTLLRNPNPIVLVIF
jgi:hypothetical protein